MRPLAPVNPAAPDDAANIFAAPQATPPPAQSTHRTETGVLLLVASFGVDALVSLYSLASTPSYLVVGVVLLMFVIWLVLVIAGARFIYIERKEFEPRHDFGARSGLGALFVGFILVLVAQVGLTWIILSRSRTGAFVLPLAVVGIIGTVLAALGFYLLMRHLANRAGVMLLRVAVLFSIISEVAIIVGAFRGWDFLAYLGPVTDIVWIVAGLVTWKYIPQARAEAARPKQDTVLWGLPHQTW